MLTGSQEQVDSLNHSAQIDVSLQFAMDVVARQMDSGIASPHINRFMPQ